MENWAVADMLINIIYDNGLISFRNRDGDVEKSTLDGLRELVRQIEEDTEDTEDTEDE